MCWNTKWHLIPCIDKHNPFVQVYNSVCVDKQQLYFHSKLLNSFSLNACAATDTMKQYWENLSSYLLKKTTDEDHQIQRTAESGKPVI